MKHRRVERFFAIVAVVLGLGPMAGCLDDPFSYGSREGGGSVPDSVGYASDVYPILLSYCSTCHSAGGGASVTGYVLRNDSSADYDMIA